MTIDNNRATFDYTVLEEIEAGLELLGFEVKSLRAGHGSALVPDAQISAEHNCSFWDGSPA